MADQKYISGKKNILVTGGAGFIGSHLCEELLEQGNHVICLDDFTSSNVRNINHLLRHEDFIFINHDINKPINLEEFKELERFKVRFQGIQEIYHLACPTSAKNFDQLRIKTLLTNSVGTINVLELALKNKAKILLASSSVVYGPRRKENPYFKEEEWGRVNLLSPRSCYDEGKRFAESCFITYRDFYGLDCKIVRIFRTYGPRMPLFDGQMIPDFVLQALNNKPLIIYGDENFSTSLCYIADLIEGLIKMMESEEKGPINLGSPDVYKLKDIAEAIIKLTNSSSEIVFKPPLLFMTPLGLPDITLAKEKLNWFPVTPIEDGLRKTVEDVKVNQALLQPFLWKYDEDLK